jgi:hypothetical protein
MYNTQKSSNESFNAVLTRIHIPSEENFQYGQTRILKSKPHMLKLIFKMSLDLKSIGRSVGREANLSLLCGFKNMSKPLNIV